jgi:uncharacterized damage-inducible protein DinB
MVRFPRPQPGDYDPYYQTYLDKVPDGVEDVILFLKKQGVTLMNRAKKLTDAQTEKAYAEGKWTAKEVLGHLIDTERLFAFRALWIARGEPAEQPGMDENLWAANSDAGARPLRHLWREHHVARTNHLYLLKSFDAAAAGRRGAANGAQVTVAAIPWLIAGHERHHLDVLRDRYGLTL